MPNNWSSLVDLIDDDTLQITCCDNTIMETPISARRQTSFLTPPTIFSTRISVVWYKCNNYPHVIWCLKEMLLITCLTRLRLLLQIYNFHIFSSFVIIILSFFLFQSASQNLPVAINLSRCQEFLLITMKLNSMKRIPVNIDSSVSIPDIVPFSLERIKLRVLAKPIDELITRYSELNTQLSEETVVSVESELDALKSMLLTVQQRRIEALFYSNLHISTNIGRLSGDYIIWIIGNSERVWMIEF